MCPVLLQGFIWVEAHKMDYVRDALRGLRLIFHSKPVHQVPLAQMVETISVPKPSQALLGAPSLWSTALLSFDRLISMHPGGSDPVHCFTRNRLTAGF
jgi:Early transcription elongation factor of RNA pol II, NGN section